MDLQKQINELYKRLETKSNEPAITIPPDENNEDAHITYNYRRNVTIIINMITFILFGIAYYTQSEWMAVTIGILTVTLGIGFGLFMDWHFTKGDSFDKISKDGISLSITFFAIVILFIGGLQFGERFSPERIKGESLQRIEVQIGEIQNELNKQRTNTPAKNDEESWDKGNTR